MPRSAFPLVPLSPDGRAEIAIVGGGPAGLVTALALAAVGRTVLVLAPGAASRDTRTTAILGDGIELLRNLGVWTKLEAVSAPLTGIRLVDDRGGLLRAPEVLFRADEVGRASFGFNVPNAALVAALQDAARRSPHITLIDTAGVTRVTASAEAVHMQTLENTEISAQLAIGADGRRSLMRDAAGIATRDWSYPQTALAFDVAHSREHHGISTELHRQAGPLTTVPLPSDADGARSSIVWVETPAEAQRLLTLADVNFVATLSSRLAGLLGKISAVSRRGAFPINGLMATTVARGRVALVGEAAHVLPPIGAQGLNLGFRDAAALAEALAQVLTEPPAHGPGDPGAPEVIAAYAQARSSDLVSREIGIDLLNRALLSNLLPMQMMRGLGLHALANSEALRRSTILAGLAAPGPVPHLMQPGRAVSVS